MNTIAIGLFLMLTPLITQGQRESGYIKALRCTAAEFEALLAAIAVVESNNNPNAVGDGGKAVGLLQIWPIVIDDVNRILGRDAYSYADRWYPVKSKEIALIYMSRYASYGRLGRIPTFEDMARIWNSGPNGYKKESTKAYWLKVKARLEIK